MDTILEILETIKPGADFASSTDFIEEHLLESMEILQLVSELNDEFDINITLPYIKPENFKSVESICNEESGCRCFIYDGNHLSWRKNN